MQQTIPVINRPLTFRELKEFAATNGPALTVYVPAELPGGQNRKLSTRLSKLAHELKERCGERGIEGQDCERFVAPIRDQAEAIEAESGGAGLILFRSPEEFRYYWLPKSVEAETHLAGNFHVRPVLDVMRGEKRFYLLALSQKEPRLLLCTEHSSEVVDAGYPESLLAFQSTVPPDHNLREKATSGPGVGASPNNRMNNVSFGTDTESEHKDENLYHFFHEINKLTLEKLKTDQAPLVIAGVEYELAIYARVNTYQNSCPENVRGAANGLKGGELHARALDALAAFDETKIEAVLKTHEKQGGGFADASVADIVRAAYEGRVSHLIASPDGRAFGNFDEATHRVRQHRNPVAGDEDLINAAAVQTILHGGEVVIAAAERVPGGRPMAAVMRY